ncbi:hypothetical protein C5C26_03325 [Rathayibacter sp. AY2B1]|uniref:hypothetical protein n=1 Tax=Rathayibacter sp. AY2B1 TaxID=2080568 RepID=UPI000CE90CBE|nr:hypothetical protein [Rathayibacter sp. AY2B1]PPG10479.1 hypothetical protein C5C26_03325 [Rathayibacter sp. AY2B1]
MRSNARRTTAGAAIAVVVAVLAGCTPPEPALTAARVLQAVSVAVSSDGGVRAIEGTALAVGDDPSDTSATTTVYDPSEVAADLPVRVRPSWRTADASGTDPADLAGRSGRIEISLAVENLTVRPEEVAFDAAGRAARQHGDHDRDRRSGRRPASIRAHPDHPSSRRGTGRCRSRLYERCSQTSGTPRAGGAR